MVKLTEVQKEEKEDKKQSIADLEPGTIIESPGGWMYMVVDSWGVAHSDDRIGRMSLVGLGRCDKEDEDEFCLSCATKQIEEEGFTVLGKISEIVYEKQ